MGKVYVSDVLEKPGGFKYSLRILLFDGLAMLFDGFDFMIVSFTMTQIMEEMELGLMATGSLASFSLIGMLIGGFVAGWLADRFGRRHVLNVSIMVYAAFTVPIFFAHSFDAFAICRILSGMGVGAVIPLSVTIASEYAPTKHRGLFVTVSKMFMILGWVVAGLVAMWVVPLLGWRFCYLIGGFPFVYGILMYFLMPESVQWLLRKGRVDKAVAIVNQINRTLDEPRPEPYVADELAVKPLKPKGQVRTLLSKKYLRVTLGIWIVAFATCALSYGLTNWMPTVLTMHGYSIAEGYGLTTLMNALGALGALFAGFMADKIGRLNSTYLAVGLAHSVDVVHGFLWVRAGPHDSGLHPHGIHHQLRLHNAPAYHRRSIPYRNSCDGPGMRHHGCAHWRPHRAHCHWRRLAVGVHVRNRGAVLHCAFDPGSRFHQGAHSERDQRTGHRGH